MEPHVTQSSKKIQLCITGVLMLVLITLLGGYIYYGMYLARTETAPETPVAPSTVMSDEDGAARRGQILDALTQESETSLSIEEREAVLETLSAESGTPSQTEEERIQILDALQGTDSYDATQ